MFSSIKHPLFPIHRMNCLPSYQQKLKDHSFYSTALSKLSQKTLSSTPLMLYSFSMPRLRSDCRPFSSLTTSEKSRAVRSESSDIGKNLPIGIQSFEKIVKENCLYIDKTDLIYKLITEGQRYFLSRPRRFGKSLLLSTLESIFKGDKNLFKNCSIYNKNYNWEKHPIIYLDFTRFRIQNSEELESELKIALEDIALSYGKSIRSTTLQRAFDDLIVKLSEIGPVVVLIDEYDKPVVDNLDQFKVAENNQHLLKDFYGILKGLDKYLAFVFITGVTKFSQISLLSGPNNLKDITINPDYSTLLGYTDAEIHQYMQERIQQIAHERLLLPETGEDEVLAEMKEWYAGYRFSWGAPLLHNPHSTLNFLDIGRVQNYWYQTATPKFLIEQIRKSMSPPVLPLSKILAEEDELLDIGNLTQIDLKSLMYQTGYLTIQDYHQLTRLYELDFPNREVREAFYKSVFRQFANLSPSTISSMALECRQQLEAYALTPFIRNINSIFSTISYSLSSKGIGNFYHSIFIAMLESMGIRTQKEKLKKNGSIDFTIEMKNCFYIIEIKLKKDAETAIKQIENKRYREQYSSIEKDIVLLVINFSEEARGIADCKAILYRKDSKDEDAFENIPVTI